MNSTLATAAIESHRVLVYYQTQYNNNLPANSPFGHYVSPLPLIGLITHLLLAAWHINLADVSVHLNDFVPTDPFFAQMWEDIAVMQSTGIKVIGMLGGAAPGTYECLTPDKFDTYYPVLAGYIEQFHLDGIDLDSRAKDFGEDFIITAAPVASALVEGGNLSGFDYVALEATLGHQISWYNAQFYSGFGFFFPDDLYLQIVNFGSPATRIDPSRLIATTLTTPDAGAGFIPIDEVVDSIKTLSAMQDFNFGGVAGWEYYESLPGGPDQPQEWAQIMSDTMKALATNATVLAKSKAEASEAKTVNSRVVRRSQ
ncbi:endo-beta-N-acetylglucosaminidase [Roridomyces roridus]|uniref:Endo-beta-N-acetylglucosaminidase n=1 Tax=Roridomyces roridus TaxID=1738132 RepID=A0AAD7FGU9_9AGAR|nr:endo-beta-N-acetylglucosaminidase [Roridomyces roridus]